MRDFGPTFVVDDERPGVLGAVDWIFNGWGAPEWAEWRKSAEIARFVAAAGRRRAGLRVLVNEGGGIHVDGEGTVLVTETVQLDPRRNPYADSARVEAELARTIGATTPSGCRAASPATTTTSAPTATSTSSRRSRRPAGCCCTSSPTPSTPTSR